jgi:hypothetical protein
LNTSGWGMAAVIEALGFDSAIAYRTTTRSCATILAAHRR